MACPVAAAHSRAKLSVIQVNDRRHGLPVISTGYQQGTDAMEGAFGGALDAVF